MASFRCVNPPAAEPVSLAEARDFLRLGDEEDDALCLRFMKAARERVEELTGRALMAQTWRMAADLEEGRRRKDMLGFALARPPYLSFVEARVARDDGSSVLVALEQVRVDGEGGVVWLTLDAAALAGRRVWRPVEIVWRAGWADADAVPDALKAAILMLAARAWERRDSLNAPEAATPEGVAALIAPWRVARL